MDKNKIDTLISNLITLRAKTEEIIHQAKLSNELIDDTIFIFNSELEKQEMQTEPETNKEIIDQISEEQKIEEFVSEFMKTFEETISKMK